MDRDTEYKYYQLKKACAMVSDYFKQEIEERIMDNKVPVLVKDFVTSFYYLDCDDYGYPKNRDLTYLSFSSPCVISQDFSTVENMTIMKKRVIAQRPMIVQQWGEYGFIGNEKPRVFLWEGQIVENKELPVEQLDVKYLQQLAQKCIENREGLYLDEALTNRLIK